MPDAQLTPLALTYLYAPPPGSSPQTLIRFGLGGLVGWSGLIVNLTDIDLSLVAAIRQVRPESAHSPAHPANFELPSGTAVRVTRDA